MPGLNIILTLCLLLLCCAVASAQFKAQKDSIVRIDTDTVSVLARNQAGSIKNIPDSVSKFIPGLNLLKRKDKKDTSAGSMGLPENIPVHQFKLPGTDTLSSAGDSLLSDVKNMSADLAKKMDTAAKGFKENIKQSITGLARPGNIKPGSIAVSMLPSLSFKGMLQTKPFIQLNGGWLSYNFNYRSAVDTPFTEKNIQQHNSYGYLNLSVAGLPFNLNYLVRRSNSAYFRNINDIQLQFDALQFRNNLLTHAGIQIQNSLQIPGDSLLKLNINTNLEKYRNISGWLNDPFTVQKLLEYKELIAVPQLSYTPGLPDSVNEKTAADAAATATAFINQYESRKKEAAVIKNTVDSLQHAYKIVKDALELQKKAVSNISSGAVLSSNYKSVDSLIPRKYRWLLHIRKFGLGRNQLNYSELTSKNMSLTGVNFEYNSWYYVAFAAGTIDYRFRDFAVTGTKRAPQYMTMLRLGIGKAENTHFITSLYRGRKQLYAASGSSTAITAIDITGIALEGKWKINPNSYLLAEAAGSVAPDFRTTPATTSKFGLGDKSNKALSLKYYLYLPKTFSKIEAAYKYTGANFQSFSSFQTNAETISWSVKGDQYLLQRKLKITLAIKKNEFSNPYIKQAYTNNTVFKSVQLTYRAKHFPVISAGFAPMSQITAVDSQLVENMFYSLNASLSHNYTIGIRRATTSIIYNRFYNNQQDTSFLYYRAENIFFTQSIAFSSYIMNLSLSHSSNSVFALTVFDAGVQFNIKKAGMLGVELK